MMYKLLFIAKPQGREGRKEKSEKSIKFRSKKRTRGNPICKKLFFNCLYLLLAFPLGIGYGVFLLVGWFLGYGLLSGGLQAVFLTSDLISGLKILPILLSGICVWLLVILTCWVPAQIERRLSQCLLGVSFSSVSQRFSHQRGLYGRVWAYLSDPVTWKSVVFIALKLPLVIALFTAVIGLLSAVTGMLFAPLAHLIGYTSFVIGRWRVDTWGETFLASAIGVFAVSISLHLLNGLALASGWFAKVMLGGSLHGMKL